MGSFLDLIAIILAADVKINEVCRVFGLRFPYPLIKGPLGRGAISSIGTARVEHVGCSLFTITERF